MSKPWLSWVLWGFQVVVFGYFVSLIALNFLLLFLSSLWCRRYKQKSLVHPIDMEALASLGPSWEEWRGGLPRGRPREGGNCHPSE